MSFTKRVLGPAGAAEAAGLRWLRSAEQAGGPRVVEVLEVQPEALVLESIATGEATQEAARGFGAALARLHTWLWPERAGRDDAAPPRFGQLPPGHPPSVPALFGPAGQLLELGAGRHSSWGAFHAAERLDPVLGQLDEQAASLRSRSAIASGDPEVPPVSARLHRASSSDLEVLRAARDRIAAGDFDGSEPASLLHGDLWSGNVLWSPQGAVLIDPAAHAGHRESDLAMLQLFGLPHLDTVLEPYQETAPLEPGWQDRVPVHQFFYLGVHWLLFGPAYREATMTAARRILAL
ncbi:fructosamine kinase family protein [Nesterenkonia alkaliphila]|uniref:Phosphotransferase n=1 Tax=Nesterenkonia alkaliphila TaxID=1463631 RepID=A0A7K1UJV1_9MICC|nr:fructosamine kinase family protein [Nesterenkonia alkaliphila]MVT26767.1 phosphotransferase [Nesterenkonia alkaliphila]GFZ77266.1 fructosamine kinase [Nesterenkonia alkaliphila]